MFDELDVDEDEDEDEEPGPPTQAPALSWSEEKLLRAGLAWRESLEWLMTPEVDDLDPVLLLTGLVSRPAWHARAACRVWIPSSSSRSVDTESRRKRWPTASAVRF